MSSDPVPTNLIDELHAVLSHLSDHPYPFVANPPTAPKRASVSILIRINPDYAHWPPARDSLPLHTPGESTQQRLEGFFGQEWVRHGDPEVLFIKRSARKEDKWSSHVAVPGGRRDPEDPDDRAAAIRETWEEVGLDLREENAISVGNLAQRIVTTSWGKTPIMVYCPYVFLITKHDIPPLRLQPAEIASAHWVSLKALLNPSQRTVESVDIAKRYAKDLRGWHSALGLGEMIFAAVRLVPSESVYSTAQAGFLPTIPARQPISSRLGRWFSNKPIPAPSTDTPLHLWGLTLGVMADFLDLLPPHNAIRLWIYPTFTAPDLQFVLWALSRHFRSRKTKSLEDGMAKVGPLNPLEAGTQAKPLRNESFAPSSAPSGTATPDPNAPSKVEAGIEGLGVSRGSRSDAVGALLEGYYDYIRRAVQVTLLGRATILGAVVFYIIRRRKR